jgi:hypothetical protein
MNQPFTPHQRGALADVMNELACEIEQLGGVLCTSPELASRFPRELQALDLIAQMQQAMASLLQADCMGCAIDDVRIESLRNRLAACLPAGLCRHEGHQHHHHRG